MKLEVKNEKNNPLLKRKELTVLVNDYEITPKRADIVKQLASELGTGEKNIIVEKIGQEYGKKQAVCTVKVYESEEMRKKYEPRYQLVRHGETVPERVKKAKKGKKKAGEEKK